MAEFDKYELNPFDLNPMIDDFKKKLVQKNFCKDIVPKVMSLLQHPNEYKKDPLTTRAYVKTFLSNIIDEEQYICEFISLSILKKEHFESDDQRVASHADTHIEKTYNALIYRLEEQIKKCETCILEDIKDEAVAKSLVEILSGNAIKKPWHAQEIKNVLSSPDITVFNRIYSEVKDKDFEPTFHQIEDDDFDAAVDFCSENGMLSRECNRVEKTRIAYNSVGKKSQEIVEKFLYTRQDYMKYMTSESDKHMLDTDEDESIKAQYEKTKDLISKANEWENGIDNHTNIVSPESVYIITKPTSHVIQELDDDGEAWFLWYKKLFQKIRLETLKENELEQKLKALIKALSKLWFLSKFRKLHKAIHDLDVWFDDQIKTFEQELTTIASNIEKRTKRTTSGKRRFRKLSPEDVTSYESKIAAANTRREELNGEEWLLAGTKEAKENIQDMLKEIDKLYDKYWKHVDGTWRIYAKWIDMITIKNFAVASLLGILSFGGIQGYNYMTGYDAVRIAKNVEKYLNPDNIMIRAQLIAPGTYKVWNTTIQPSISWSDTTYVYRFGQDDMRVKVSEDGTSYHIPDLDDKKGLKRIYKDLKSQVKE